MTSTNLSRLKTRLAAEYADLPGCSMTERQVAKFLGCSVELATAITTALATEGTLATREAEHGRVWVRVEAK